MNTAQLSDRQFRGQRAFLAGLSAEETVARCYDQQGVVLLAQRWRGRSGEIDLILSDQDLYIFCEVKASRSFDRALRSLREAQIYRIHATASEYLADTPKGALSDVRFDLALVNGQGEVQLHPGMLSHF